VAVTNVLGKEFYGFIEKQYLHLDSDSHVQPYSLRIFSLNFFIIDCMVCIVLVKCKTKSLT